MPPAPVRGDVVEIVLTVTAVVIGLAAIMLLNDGPWTSGVLGGAIVIGAALVSDLVRRRRGPTT